MSRFNQVPSGDTVGQDAISSFYFECNKIAKLQLENTHTSRYEEIYVVNISIFWKSEKNPSHTMNLTLYTQSVQALNKCGTSTLDINQE